MARKGLLGEKILSVSGGEKMSYFSAEFRRETLPWFVAIACIAFIFAVSAIFFWCLDAAPIDLRPRRCGAAVGAPQSEDSVPLVRGKRKSR